MKKSSIICTVAALMVAGLTLASCTDEKEQALVGQTFTMTVNASKGDTEAAKDLSLDLDGTTLIATWKTGEKVYVHNNTTGRDLDGYLEAKSDGASTTLQGSLTGDIAVGNSLELRFCSSDNYASQGGTIEWIATHCDYAIATVSVTSISPNVSTSDAAFENQQAIVKFILKKYDNKALLSNPSSLTVNYGTSSVSLSSIPTATYTINGDGVLYVALPGFSNQSVTLTATVGDSTYTKSVSGVSFANGQYYTVIAKMHKPTVTWDENDIAEIDLPIDGFFEKDGISATADGGDTQWDPNYIFVSGGEVYFSSSIGNITSIVMTGFVLDDGNLPDGWSVEGTTFTWNGTPAATVSLAYSEAIWDDGLEDYVETTTSISIEEDAQIVFTVE